MKNFLSEKICLTLVIIQKIQSLLMRLIKKLLPKWIWWNYCKWICWIRIKTVLKLNGQEYNTAKSLSIATEFVKFKDVSFNKKIIRHTIKIIQSKKHKFGTYKIDKESFSCFDDKRWWNFYFELFSQKQYHKL